MFTKIWLAIGLVLLTSGPLLAEPQISKDELKAILGKPGIHIIDIRSIEEWEYSSFKIPGAVHEAAAEWIAWADKYPKDDTMVIYCA